MTISTRTGGFSSLPGVFLISPTLQFLYALMMYIPTTPIWFVLKPLTLGADESSGKAKEESKPASSSRLACVGRVTASKVFPSGAAIFRKRISNGEVKVLPEKFLCHGKLAKDRADDEDDAIDNNVESEESEPTTFAGQMTTQLLKLANQELPFLYGCTMLVLLIDNKPLRSQTFAWLNVWGVIFEIAAAWGTAGLTLATGSLCLAYHLSPVSRFIFTVVMIKARLRVPVAIDPVVDLELDEDFASPAQKPWEASSYAKSGSAAPVYAPQELGGGGGTLPALPDKGARDEASPSRPKSTEEKFSESENPGATFDVNGNEAVL